MIEKEMTEVTLLWFLSAVSMPEALLLAEDAHQEPLLLQCNAHAVPSVDVMG